MSGKAISAAQTRYTTLVTALLICPSRADSAPGSAGSTISTATLKYDRATRPRIGINQLNMTAVSNQNCEKSGTAKTFIYVVNDNNGTLFHFEKLANQETWATRESLQARTG